MRTEEGAAVTHRVDLTDEVNIGPGINTIEIRDNPPDPAQSLGASILVFYSVAGEVPTLAMFDGVDYAYDIERDSISGEYDEALQNAVPVTFTFEPAEEEREAKLTLFMGDIAPGETDRPNSLKIEVGDLPTQQIGPDPNPFQGEQGRDWDNFVMSVTIPASTETLRVFPVLGPGDNPASLVWVLAGLSLPQSL